MQDLKKMFYEQKEYIITFKEKYDWQTQHQDRLLDQM